MTLTAAREVVRAIIFGEHEAAVDGNAYLDPRQIEALEVLLSATNYEED